MSVYRESSVPPAEPVNPAARAEATPALGAEPTRDDATAVYDVVGHMPSAHVRDPVRSVAYVLLLALMAAIFVFGIRP